MTEPVESEYFDWLKELVIDYNPNSDANYYDLFRILYSTEFVWDPVLAHGDHNRADDGKELRIDFLREKNMHSDEDPLWLDGPCSVFEMLIAFAKRAEFQTDMPYREWFWKFLENLDLHEYRRVSRRDLSKIEEKLETFLERKYGGNGRGGILPMRVPWRNQKEVEIWYQFFDYLQEQGI